MPKRRQKLPGPKPWRARVAMRQHSKNRERQLWTAARWRRFDDEREEKREIPNRARERMQRRLEALQRQQDSEARSARMKAYHARRRGLAAAAGKS